MRSIPHRITTYKPKHKEDVEKFREQSFREGSDSLAYDKFDPDGFMGQVWLVYAGQNLIGLCAMEASHYTGDPRIAARCVRLHILEKYRSTAFGLVLAPYMVRWCKKQGYKIMWWSADIDLKALNAVYQRKHLTISYNRKNDLNYREDPWGGWYQNVVFDKRMLFQVDPRSDLLQYVYWYRVEEGYNWKPKTNMLYYYHNGDTKLIKRMRPFLSETPIDLAT
jgi:GNAT superfamily N-acetyltransferase